ncbi:UDP-N-acetylmuramoyl-L-alanine--D-glutamate ligase [uncultured Veillonella sp.]|uniref:UDP-N-acetylmuramoyl-L-alanine--D-glutamate ligase n=1 Tax=uncultured Veillonella sp. TaxID=159268 RepID=UPI0025CB80D6|nr:UDP-N-acetylmuramoyl-L-alanine--D-glutamate ligase [uncultured Veillonella sp.]MDY3974071.1 UDP-N-acetylmuramoyl-L-alanine--D-glutamate ligase [Veillonella caviae]
MEFKGKQILVLGAGRSGIGVAHVLATVGAQVVLNDYKEVQLATSEQALLTRSGVTVITGHQENELLDSVDYVVVSPGIALTIPILEEAKKRQIPIVGEVEVAFKLSKAPILGVTGTNGKTTTTTLLAKAMAKTGKSIKVGGNIGQSLSEEALTIDSNGYLVAELSSYQLESVIEFRPVGAIMLNITPDHLQRHKTMEAYQAAKENIFKHQGPSDVIVLNMDDPVVARMADYVPSKVLCISQTQRVTDGAYFANNTCYAVKNGESEVVITADRIHIPGQHNIENILAVIALAYHFGVSAHDLGEVIEQFQGVEHRIERVFTIDGVTFYNDSKATNTDSAIKALEAFKKPVILLAGGYDKMTDLTDFMAEVKVNAKVLILMGAAAQRFGEAAKAAGVESIYFVDSMKEAVAKSFELATTDDIVLLSPACSSYDWYHCFEERGDDFKQEVQALAQCYNSTGGKEQAIHKGAQ